MFRSTITSGRLCIPATFSIGLLFAAGCLMSDEGQIDDIGMGASDSNAVAQSPDANTPEGALDGANSAGGASQIPSVPHRPTVFADAGPDQVVEDNALVTLTGRGRSESGAAISYSWRQLEGTSVALVGAASSTLAFSAPNESDVLRFSLSVSAAGETVVDEVEVVVRAAPFLIVANRGGNSLARYLATSKWAGDVEPDGFLTGRETRLSGPTSVVIDNVGGAIVVNPDSGRLAGYLAADTLDGDAAPERYVGGAASALTQPEAIAFDAKSDTLFVASFDAGPGSVGVFASVSTPAFFGPLPPTRQIRSHDIANARDLELAPNGELYVVNSGSQSVSVFANAATLDGDSRATRVISGDALQNALLLDACVIAPDTLLLLDGAGRRIFAFDKASTLNGQSTPNRVVMISGFGQLAGIAVDAAGRGYVTDSTNNAIYIINDVANRAGSVEADRTIQGANTGLSEPWHMAILER
ncbi:MAG: hypothetical protein KDA32_10860 [Phycisphaerales bacterium]|nr:hypothetical protein [Phycisphaerales bacterium]